MRRICPRGCAAWLPMLAMLASLAADATPARAEPPAQKRGSGAARPSGRPFGLERRVPWTTSNFSGTPEPPAPYLVTPAFPKLTFQSPVVVAAAPGIDRLFVGQVQGKILSFPVDPNCEKADLALDLKTVRPGLSNFYGLTFHPKFAQNHYVYVCYVEKDADPNGTRLSRFTMTKTDPPQIDPTSEKLIITWLGGGHNGACLAFGPDGYLYFSAGDAERPTPADSLMTGQDISDLLSSVMRIDVDHEDKGKPYRVPPDNPFVDLKDARPEVWAYGMRNPWKMSFDRETGQLWVGDVGWELWEMIYRVERGGNYGWSIVEGPQPVHAEGKRGPTPISPPAVSLSHSEASSITGGYVYRGKALPGLVGLYVYGDYQTGTVWGLKHDGTKTVSNEVIASTPLQLVAFGEDNAGELYALDHQRTQQLYKFVPNPAAGATVKFPRKLSQTGLFSQTKEQVPAPGVLPYSINAEFWADGAHGSRYLALPGKEQIEVSDRGGWNFPDGTVLARTVGLELEKGKPASRKNIETQVLHLEEGSWRPYSYVWDSLQEDATLADAAGTNLSFQVVDADAPGGKRTQAYRVSSRVECLICHNPWVEKKTTIFGRPSASPLAVSTGQWNKSHEFSKGKVDNQLRTFEHIGLFKSPIGAVAGKPGLAKMADPYDKKAKLEDRARSYLQVNCSHCHQFGAGGSANIVLSNSVMLDQTNAIDVRPIQGTFNLSGAKIIAAGEPDSSVLYYRICKTGGGRMPRMGSNLVDERGVALIHDWIETLPSKGNEPPKVANRGSAVETKAPPIDTLLASTSGALELMRLVENDRLDAAAKRQAIAKASASTQVEIRDLFERFLPEADRVKRLGDSIDPAVILATKGDPARGLALFKESGTQCKSCHKLDGVGLDFGPDLAKIGVKYTRPELLRHIMEPSHSVDPKYVGYLLESKDGQVHTGMLVSRSADEVVMRGPQEQTIRVPADQVEEFIPQAKSLMPELLLKDLTAQQAGDLLDFLMSLK
ncbi:PQQ-dependent sugar dehydrogenase [Isosphaeraceae bacterium EP7]